MYNVHANGAALVWLRMSVLSLIAALRIADLVSKDRWAR
jgi:hypothetical protein